MTEISHSLLEKAAAIKLLLTDCDGVLTDGRLYFSEHGETIKVFNVRDGQGLTSWHAAGFQSGIISGRDAETIIKIRADELGIKYVRVKSKNKVADFNDIIAGAGVSPDEAAFIGDDVGDLPLLKIVGLPVAVADASEELISFVSYVTKKKGGEGAVREVIDLILKSKSA